MTRCRCSRSSPSGSPGPPVTRLLAVRHATFSRLRGPQLPPLLRRTDDFPERHVDADGGASVARAHAHPLCHHARLIVALQTLPMLLLGPYGGRDRRPGGQAPTDDPLAGPDGLAGASARHPDRNRRGASVWEIGVLGRPPGPQQRLREPGQAVVHAGDGRLREPAQRGQPQLGARQRGAQDRPGVGGHPDRDGRRGRLLPGQRGQLRRRDRLAGDASIAARSTQPPDGPRAGSAARGPALRQRRPASLRPAADDGAGGHARVRVPGHPAGDGPRGTARRAPPATAS